MFRHGSALALALSFAAPALAQDSDTPPTPKAPKPGEMEVRYIDGSVMKLRLLDPVVTLETRYGQLQIPIEDLHRVELATRIPPDDAARSAKAVSDLGSTKFKLREEAMAELMKLGEKAYPDLLRASDDKNPEVAARAKKLLGEIRARVPAERLEYRERDVVKTPHSTIAGKLQPLSLKVVTFQFGEQEVKLSDLMSMRSLSVEPEEPKNVLEDPGTLVKHHNLIGKTFHFRVTGKNNGSVWGTGTYTSDSSLAVAAVHAGAVKVGETKAVKVKIVAPPPMFQGSTKNGVTTSPYAQYPGAYQVVVGR